MRILVLSKRQYTGKDLLNDRFGRLWEIPAGLAARGHEVVGVALSYRRRDSGWRRLEDVPNLGWLSVNAVPNGLWQYPKRLAKTVADFQPEVIWACSDAFHAIAGAALSRFTGIPLVIDLYDNFESFAASRLPGVHPLFREACRRAAALTVVSHSLRDYIVPAYGISAAVAVVANGVRRELFHTHDRQLARASLSLPAKGRFIGTAGAITADRGIEALFEAFLALAPEHPDLHLVFAGPRDETRNRYHHPRIIDLGILAFEQVPKLFSALDVAVVCNRNSNFGRYCFPLKLFEIIACGTPLVAASVGDIAATLSAHPYCLYNPADSADLTRRISHQLRTPEVLDDLDVPDWRKLTDLVEKLMLDIWARSAQFSDEPSSPR